MPSFNPFGFARVAACITSFTHFNFVDNIVATSSAVTHHPQATVKAQSLEEHDVAGLRGDTEGHEAGVEIGLLCVREEGMSKAVTMAVCTKRVPYLGAEQVLCTVPSTRLRFYHRAPAPLCASSKSWALVRYRTLENHSIVKMLKGITSCRASGSVAEQDGCCTEGAGSRIWGPDVFHALFYPPTFHCTAVEEKIRQTQLNVADRCTIPIDLILMLSAKVLVQCTVPKDCIENTDITVSKSQRLHPVPLTPPKGKENVNAPASTPMPVREQRSRPRILMPFINRLVEQQQFSNSRIPLCSPEAYSATPKSTGGSSKSRAGKQALRSPATPSRPPKAKNKAPVTPSPMPSPASVEKPANKEKHWRKRRTPKAKAALAPC